MMTVSCEPSSGTLDGRVHRFAVRAYFEDTDLSGVVYHANYLRWCERARTEMLRLIGIEQREVQQAGGGAYAIADVTIRYIRPAQLDDAMVIETRVTELRAASCRMHQQVWRDETLLAEAHFRVGFVGPDGRPRRQPGEWHRAIAAISNNESPE